MASHIEIGTGPLTARIDWANDARVQATLLRWYEIRGVGPDDATPAQKLNAVLQDIVREIVHRLEQHEQSIRMETLLDEIRQEYGLE